MSDLYEIQCTGCGDGVPVSEVVRIGGNPRAFCLDCLNSTVAELRLRQWNRRQSKGTPEMELPAS